MATKNIQLSTRVTDGDAAFLAQLEIEGAHTPSDKIRALIGEARRRHEGRRDYRSALEQVSDLLAPVQRDLRAAEHATATRSELVRVLADWVPEAVAFLMSETAAADAAEPPATARRLDAIERGLADRTFALISSILRLGVTEDAPCYDPAAISARLGPILNLLDALRAARDTTRAGTR